MEADWEFEVGGDAPAIETRWEGFVDLRLAPERAWELPETVHFPALAAALAKLNAPRSPVWTSKCDFWPRLESGAFDPDEMDAPSGGFAHAMGCYIDLLPRSDGQWRFPALAEATCKQVCAVMGAVPLRSCRLDLMIRRAFIAPDRMDLGITAYVTSCGASPEAASCTLAAALAAIADALSALSTVE
jgi:hypothetical protein